jgi:hypothetical protein
MLTAKVSLIAKSTWLLNLTSIISIRDYYLFIKAKWIVIWFEKEYELTQKYEI